MAVKVGSARIDENGKAKGGKAGDQTGKEVSMQNWYKHSKGWRVFRAKDPNKALLIARDMQYACANNNIGYDQSQRDTLYNVAKEVNFNCNLVKKKCETDCSALVRVCCAYAGIMLPNFRTANEGKVLLASGAFDEMTGVKYTDSSSYLCAGDILVTKTSGHTVVVLNNGTKADNERVVSFNTVLVIGKTVFIRKEPSIESLAVGIAKQGEKFVYNRISKNGWYSIIYESCERWISSKYAILTNT